MVGAAVARRLAREDCHLLTVARRDLDLTRQGEVEAWMSANRPEVVVVAAARVGGILANSTFPAEFIRDNLLIEANLIDAAWRSGVSKLLFLGSACIYPREAPQPMTEEVLLSGPLEPTNEWYAIAKIAGIKLCQAYRRQYGCDFIAAQPNNLYGPGDNFNLQASHVIPALMRKIHDAKPNGTVTIWGTGTPLREFLHVDDLADAAVFLLKHYSDELHVNIGTGEEISIADLARLIGTVVGFQGEFIHDLSKPDGAMRKLLDVSRLHRLGWQSQIGLRDGLATTYRWFLDNQDSYRG